MLKIFALFLFLFSSLFSMSITYASITIDKPIVQQIQYEEQTQQYNAINLEYNNKEITIPCVTKKTDTIDKPVLFSESGSNFIFIAVSRHLGTGLYKTDALIFNADTLQNVPLKKILTLSGIISLLKFLIQLKQFLSLQPIKQSFCKINPA